MLNWTNIRLILGREIRDQLRDRRTLFMIAVLPLLLYPLMGASFFQLAQFMQEHPTRVLVVGATELAVSADAPPLFDQQVRFHEGLFDEQRDAELLRLAFDAPRSATERPAEPDAYALEKMRSGGYDAVLYFQPDFLQKLSATQDLLAKPENRRHSDQVVPSPTVYYNAARDASQAAHIRLEPVLRRWRDKVVEHNLKKLNVPTDAVRPFVPRAVDVGERNLRDAALWSKIMPFVLIIWTLTGAFYPAIDLCAGEKERGTLETLLSSPARRSEIVIGKLLTVMLFSMGTAALNLLSMGATGALVVVRLQDMLKVSQFGLPSWTAMLWLGLAIVPVSALFSALSVALAAFARSTKEGQYYLMPLILISLPLMILPMTPGVELNLGNALIPISGLTLLLRELIQGNYDQAASCILPVVAVTLVACYAAIHWAIDQFNRESVLFRESERLDLGLWLRHLVRERPALPTAAMAMLCGVLILVIRFVTSLLATAPADANGLLAMQAIHMLSFIALPAVAMAWLLTRSPRRSLLLVRPRWSTLFVGGLLALTLHPVMIAFHHQLAQLYHFDHRWLAGWSDMLRGVNPWYVWLVFAVLPAVCEELVFRGFILTGLREHGAIGRAICISAIFFGVAHPLVQQSIGAAALGLVLGLVAVRTGSLWPGVLFHMLYNTLSLTLDHWSRNPWLARLFTRGDGDMQYDLWVVALGGVASVGLLLVLRRLTTPREENAAWSLPPVSGLGLSKPVCEQTT